ncbi:MAG: adenine deaminase, partial [Clostridia bacterium]|nr:adenine deaminase [Clostridia bacterium]
MRVKNPDRSRLIAAAMGKIPCDLTIENVKFVNVITGQIYPASVDVLDGVVVRVRDEGKPAQLESA